MKGVVLFIFSIAFILVNSGCFRNDGTTDSGEEKFCITDFDCVPASCCHPDSVVNKNYAPDCPAVGCTASCEGPLDCGCGRPVCTNQICEIEKISFESYCPTYHCGSTMGPKGPVNWCQ